MTKLYFNVFLLNLVILSGCSQLEAVLLNPSSLDKLNFEIEDSEFNEVENLPRPRRSYPANPAPAKKYYEVVSDPFVELATWNAANQHLDNNLGGLDAMHDLSSIGTPKELSEWQFVPLDVSSVSAKLKKWNLVDASRAIRNPDRFNRPVRYLDYTNSQMPFNEGQQRHKSLQPKAPEVAEKNSGTENSNFNGYSGRQKRSGKSTKRKRFFEAPRRSRNLEIPRDDPLLEYSRVRRFLDHKRAKKQILMTSTLEAKEAAMSRELDPNLNADGILEPHVRKRRGLHTKKRDLSFKPRYT